MFCLFGIYRCAIEVYLHLYDHPLKDASSDEQATTGKKTTTRVSHAFVSPGN